jgi:hypothetical protein
MLSPEPDESENGLSMETPRLQMDDLDSGPGHGEGGQYSTPAVTGQRTPGLFRMKSFNNQMNDKSIERFRVQSWYRRRLVTRK